VKYFYQVCKEKSFLFLVVPFLLVSLFLLIFYGKGPSHLLVNQWNSPITDIFFKYVTHLGDGAVFAIVILVLAFVRFRWALYELFAALITLIFVFIAKQLIFKGAPRPIAFFENDETLHLVEGVKMHSWNSFPSGHTITAFAIFVTLVLIAKNNYLKTLFMLIAVLAGFSRVYLSQHFLGDIISGAVIGIFIAIASCTIVDNWALFKKGNWIDKNLLELFEKKHEQ